MHTTRALRGLAMKAAVLQRSPSSWPVNSPKGRSSGALFGVMACACAVVACGGAGTGTTAESPNGGDAAADLRNPGETDGGGSTATDATATRDATETQDASEPGDVAEAGDASAVTRSPDAQSGLDAGNAALPGDIAASAGTPLVAAHSMMRALFAAYDGKLFQVRRASDSKTQDIGPASAGGAVDLTALRSFCSGTTCSVSMLYDQTGNANHLPQATAANQPAVMYWSTSDGANWPMAVTMNHQWLRNRTQTTKIPKGAASQTEYMVVHGGYFNGGCCYDYGNMESTVHDDGAGTMSALYFGSSTDWTKGAGSGPWGMTDYENGLFAGAVADPGGTNKNYPSIAYPGNNLVTVLSKTNGTTQWDLKAGNAGTGALNTYWSGALPSGYSPLRQEGGLSLGEGGDGSNSGTGAFSEGVVIANMTTDATDNAIQSNITSTYGK
jgi:hypothetical protein